MADAFKNCQENCKFAIFIDKTGNVSTFLSYQQVALVEAFKAPIAIAMGSKTKEQLLEEWRAQTIMSMRFDGTVLLDVQAARPDWKNDYTSDVFPTDIVFDPDVIRTKEGWSKILKEEENFDRMDTKGNFFVN